jgi:NAD(P)-dependent dehydrogenase (short-subunit alcohol dehydrogenase family)
VTVPVAVVTGGAGGIGGAIVGALADTGAQVVALDLRAGEAEQGVDERVLAVRCDVADESSVRAALAAVCDRLGTPRILVNAAGVSPTRRVPLLDTSLQEWQRAMDVNATGIFLVSREFASRFRDDPAPGGRIVNVLSTASFMGWAGMGAYCASKGAGLLLTRTLAIELAALEITVNGVAPGTIETRMTEEFRADSPAQQRDAMVRHDSERTPLGRRGAPSDVAAAVAYLVSPEARWVTGEVLTVDGGYMATGCPAYDDEGRV